ncbi:MAG: hypothetical protein KDI62_16490 [Anaerolineae bacterium]|nr:hypothetical protein [Anaerolineae bacterium]MCB9107627.1 hypothetical protein [Anaerolineales bacterium]
MSSVETGSSPLWRVYEILLKLAERGEQTEEQSNSRGEVPGDHEPRPVSAEAKEPVVK